MSTDSPLPPDEHLPPVQPPTAGFIVQLFVIPAVIVLAIVGVWLLFSRLAAGDQNWQSLVAELDNQNLHRRDRAALMLAQMLSAAQARSGRETSSEQPLTENVQLAEALGRAYRRHLAQGQNSDEWYQLYLARALGMLDVPEALPPLQEGARPGHDPVVRRNALVEIALIINRAAERRPEQLAELTADRSLESDLIDASNADEPTVRHIATYALGLFPTEAARERLEVLLASADESTRANAAIGLARQTSTAGLPVFEEIFARAAEPPARPQAEPAESARVNLDWALILAILAVAAAIWGAVELYWRKAGTEQDESRGRRFRFRVGLGLITFVAVLYVLAEPPPTATDAPSPSQQAAERLAAREDVEVNFESLVALRASLKAVRELAGKFTEAERARLSQLLEPLANEHRFAPIRSDARDALAALRSESG